MMAILMIALPFVAFLGLLLVLGIVALAYFWPTVEWWLLCQLRARRRAREARTLATPRAPRLGLRWPR